MKDAVFGCDLYTVQTIIEYTITLLWPQRSFSAQNEDQLVQQREKANMAEEKFTFGPENTGPAIKQKELGCGMCRVETKK